MISIKTKGSAATFKVPTGNETSHTKIKDSFNRTILVQDPMRHDLSKKKKGTVLVYVEVSTFNPQTTIAFEIPSQQDVTLRVFDLSGRLVRNLIQGELRTPGRHEVVWNGRDDAGRQVASGTYFYRLEAGEFAETKRMVLVK